MSEPKVEIQIKTRGDTSGAVAVERAVKAAGDAAQRAGQQASPAQGNPWVTASANQRMAAAMYRQTADSAGQFAAQARKAQEAATKMAGDRARGVLYLSQAIEDAQYGLGAIINNIPMLTTAFGMGAAATGGLSMALVGLNVLFKALADGQQEAEEAAIDWSKLTPEAELDQRLADVTTALDKQAEAYRRFAENRRMALDAEREFAAWVADMSKATGGEGDPQATLQQYDRRRQQRAQAVQAGEVGVQEMQAQAAAEQAAARRQEERVRGLQRLAESSTELEQLKAEEEEARKRVIGMGETARGSQAEKDAKANLERVQANIARVQKRMTELPTLDVPADAAPEAKQAAFAKEQQAAQEARARADRAAQDADVARRQQTIAAERARREQMLDDVQTEREVIDQAGLDRLPTLPGQQSPVLAPATRGLITRRAADVGEAEGAAESPMEAATQGDAQAAEVDAALQGLLQQAGQMGEGSPMRAMLGQLAKALQDGQGDTAAELAVVQQLLGEMGQGKTQNAQAMQQALQAMGQLQAEGSQLSQSIASAMRAMAENQRALKAEMQALRNELETERSRR